MDYEGQPANHLAFRLADVILMPEALRDSGVRRQGASDRRTRFYPGFKEEIYLGDFEPAPDVLASIGVPRDGRQLVVARTPPSRATYHRFENTLFGAPSAPWATSRTPTSSCSCDTSSSAGHPCAPPSRTWSSEPRHRLALADVSAPTSFSGRAAR